MMACQRCKSERVASVSAWAYDGSTVARWKARRRYTEVRRCNLFEHVDARLGDRVEG
jgi:hypothetical protein